MSKPFLLHLQAAPWFRTAGSGLELSLFVAKALTLQTVFIRHEPDNEEALLPMQLVGYQGELAIWRGLLPLRPADENILYCFKAVTDDQQWWVHGCGVSSVMPPRAQHFRVNPHNKPPAWVQDQIFYQIFPDRFHNGDPGLHVQQGEFLYGDTNHPVIAKSWGEPVARDHLGFEVVKGEIRITVPPNTARVLLAT